MPARQPDTAATLARDAAERSEAVADLADRRGRDADRLIRGTRRADGRKTTTVAFQGIGRRAPWRFAPSGSECGILSSHGIHCPVPHLRDLDEMNSNTTTPSGSIHQFMDAINRVRIDGKAVVRTRRATDRGKPFHELHYPFAESDFPGGARTLCLALTMRMQHLVKKPVPDDERNGFTEEGVDRAAIERLAASIDPSRPLNRPNRCTD